MSSVPSSTVSLKQLRANRKNAQGSTGPLTDEGKAKSSRNATRHGIFSSVMLLPGEDPNQLKQLREGALRHFGPRDSIELEIVEQFISASWRLRRVRAAEVALYREHQAQLEEQQISNPTASEIFVAMISQSHNSDIERYHRYERRLEDSMHRCINQLRKMRNENLIGCLTEYTGTLLEELEEPEQAMPDADSSAVQNEPISEPMNVSVGATKALEWPDGVSAEEDEALASEKPLEPPRLVAA